MSTRHWSLKARLALMLIAPLIGLAAWFLIQAYFAATKTSNTVYDRVLFGSALAISDRIVIGQGSAIEVDVPYVALEMLTSAAQDRVFYRVEANGKTITGYKELPGIKQRLQPGETVYYDAKFRGADVRIVALGGAAADLSSSTPFTVYVAETTLARRQLIQETVSSSAWRIAATILAALGLVWLGIAWGLRPLERLEAALARRSSVDLRPLAHQVPSEVEPLVSEVNNLMERLDSALSATRTFTGNASHQLRTPLTVAKANLELASTETDPLERGKLITSALSAMTQCQKLVEGLLMLARLDGRESDLSRAVKLNLVELTRSACQELAPSALRREHELEFDSDQESVWLRGEPVLLAEAIRNLIDNAITHCPGSSKIKVRVTNQDRMAVVVEDNGPGIPKEERRRALERFARNADSDTRGFGLGLAISREIVEQHGGWLSLKNSALGGLKAGLYFRENGSDRSAG
ncbi:MAG: sensor histidine kinase [Pseudomonadota bacterium]